MQTSNLRDRLLSACYAGWLANVAFQLKIRFPFSVFPFPILYYVDIAKFSSQKNSGKFRREGTFLKVNVVK